MSAGVRVVHIITNLGSGGAERVLANIAMHPIENFCQVVVSLTDEGIYGCPLRENGVQVICLGMRRGSASPSAFWRLVSILRQLNPDLIMTWLYHADLMGTLAARMAGLRRVIWNIRCSNIDFRQYSPLTKITVTMLSRLSRIPIAIAANSSAGRLSHEALGYRNDNWRYLPNGFDTDIWKPDEKDRAVVRHNFDLRDAFVFGIVGRADPQKGHQTLLDAALKLISRQQRRVRFVLIGRGTQEIEIHQTLRPHVIALGERQDVPTLMRGFDALILSSEYGEGFPNAIGEAMATGLPCIATDVGDCSLIVGDTGVIVPPSDAIALCEAMGSLLETSQEVMAKMGAGARAKIAADFSLDRCLQNYAEVFAWGATYGRTGAEEVR